MPPIDAKRDASDPRPDVDVALIVAALSTLADLIEDGRTSRTLAEFSPDALRHQAAQLHLRAAPREPKPKPEPGTDTAGGTPDDCLSGDDLAARSEASREAEPSA
jgi:hypothetical protein